MYIIAGCFSILPATELVPGDLVEVTGMFVLLYLDDILWQGLRLLLDSKFCFFDVLMLNSGM
jgi:hypothetical protein